MSSEVARSKPWYQPVIDMKSRGATCQFGFSPCCKMSTFRKCRFQKDLHTVSIPNKNATCVGQSARRRAGIPQLGSSNFEGIEMMTSWVHLADLPTVWPKPVGQGLVFWGFLSSYLWNITLGLSARAHVLDVSVSNINIIYMYVYSILFAIIHYYSILFMPV